jgi:ferrochelatase
MTFLASQAFTHGSMPRTAVLLLNLGTPREPTRPAVHRYLRQFLMDRRVVEIPRLLWWLLLHAIILPLRSGASAQRYASVWTPAGSPLLDFSERQHRALTAELQQRGFDVEVLLAMRYGDPSIPAAMERLRQSGVTRLLVLPLYPQYSATTSASAFDGVMQVLLQTRNLPELRWIRNFHDDPGYIEALRRSVRAYWDANGRPDKLVMSFHGLPRRNLDLGDPYHCECAKTARLLAEALDLGPGEYALSFQSRFGRARWLEPYTVDTLRKLARDGVGRVDVVCPGFAADCLETLEEIAQEARTEFLTGGGREFHLIACLNDAPRFIAALADLVEAHTQGWPVRAADRTRLQAAARAGRERALAAGASR